MRLEHHLVGGYVCYISPHIIIIIIKFPEVMVKITMQLVTTSYAPDYFGQASDPR